MLNINELKIGNLLMDNLGVERKVTSIFQLDSITVFYLDGTQFPSIANPILLTEEILSKYGFNKIDVDGYDKGLYHEKLNHAIYGDSENGYTLVDSEGDDISFERVIKYVHQLQNLFFCLTGEELEAVTK